MSKIGKKPITIPEGVTVTIDGSMLSVKGPKGELSQRMPEGVILKVQDTALIVEKTESARWGLVRALAANMINGVAQGFEKILDFTGVGYKAQVKGETLELNLGFTNPVIIPTPAGITFQVEKNSISIKGTDRAVVGHVAAKIRSARPPEPYKGSGIIYRGEVIHRKAGKKATSTAA